MPMLRMFLTLAVVFFFAADCAAAERVAASFPKKDAGITLLGPAGK